MKFLTYPQITVLRLFHKVAGYMRGFIKTRGVVNSSKWVGKTKYYFSVYKKMVDKFPFSVKIKQKSGWAHAH